METEEIFEKLKAKKDCNRLVSFKEVTDTHYLESNPNTKKEDIPLDYKNEQRKYFVEIIRALQIDENLLQRNYHGRKGYFFNSSDVPFVKMILREYTGKLKPLRSNQFNEMDASVAMKLVEGFYYLLLHGGNLREDEIQAQLQFAMKALGYPHRLTDSFRQSLETIFDKAVKTADDSVILPNDALHYYLKLMHFMDSFISFSNQLLFEIEEIRSEETNNIFDEISETEEKIKDILERYNSMQSDTLEKNTEFQHRLETSDYKNRKLKNIKKLYAEENEIFQLAQEILSDITMPLSLDDSDAIDIYCTDNQISLELSGSQMTYQDFQILDNHFYNRERKPSEEILAEAEIDLLKNAIYEDIKKLI